MANRYPDLLAADSRNSWASDSGKSISRTALGVFGAQMPIFPNTPKGANFDPFIKQYTGMAKVIIGLAAASISFGGLNRTDPYVLTAKMLLAFRIAYTLIFCITVINFYENYLHDLKSYGPFKCALVESCGLTALFCFTLGYGYWAWHL